MPGSATASASGRPTIDDGRNSAALATSFIHFAERMSSRISTAPVCRSTSATSASRPRVVSSYGPTANQVPSAGVCRTTVPGSNMLAATSITAPSVRSGPTIEATASIVMPFWRPTTSPSAATSGAISSHAHRVS